jgi:two-component system NtrC family sensor kinase
MARSAMRKSSRSKGSLPFDEAHYRDLARKHMLRLFLTYLVPLILLTGYFFFQHGTIVSESERLHLKALAENRANTVDLFLSERRVNLINLINDPRLAYPPDSHALQTYLEDLKRMSETFVDLGYFDPSGVQTAYAGPYPALERRSYSAEHWYMGLLQRDDDFIITDIYLGFRQKLHFTIAVKRVVEGKTLVLRSTLDPGKMYEYLSSLEGSREVFTSIVNKEGLYQVVTEHLGTPLQTSSFVPPTDPRVGAERVKIAGSSIQYAYAWLRMADWALIVQWSNAGSHGFLAGMRLRVPTITAVVILLISLVIVHRARRLVQIQQESDQTRMLLEHAAKLASVGELAAGIAHEINNPLAVITEEAGVMKDLLNPEFEETGTPEEMVAHLDEIHAAAFRCRDITAKLLAFVRKGELDLKDHDVHELIDSVVDGIVGREMAVSNIELKRKYGQDVPRLMTDGNQLQQVLLNLLNNARDAIGQGPGTIAVETSFDGEATRIAVTDSGKGIPAEDLGKIFMPFYSTKEVGKGTGLGLSVSYGIVKSLGGSLDVESTPGKGSTFTIVLPIR